MNHIVDKYYRGHQLTEKILEYGIGFLKSQRNGLEVLYTTPRTVHKVAQILTHL